MNAGDESGRSSLPWRASVPSDGRSSSTPARMLRQIGRQLRDLYADLEHQPLPARLAEILERIERMDRDEKR